MPLFSADYSYNTVATISPMPASSARFLHFGVNANNDQKHINSMNTALSFYKGMFPEVDMLYNNGQKVQLIQLQNELRSWWNTVKGVATFNVSQDRKKLNYIDLLLSEKQSGFLLNQLARIAAINTPRRMRIELDRFFKEVEDPCKRCKAVILADRQTGGGNFIHNGYLPRKEHMTPEGYESGALVGRDFSIDIRQDAPQAEHLIDAEMAKYALERYLPAVGSPLTVEAANVYLQQVFDMVDYINPTQKQEVAISGILGFYSKFVDSAAIGKTHKDKVREVSQKITNSLIKSSVKNVGCVTQNIADLYVDIDDLIKKYSSDELAYKVGQRVSEAIYDCVDKMALIRGKMAVDRQIASNAVEHVTTPVAVQSGFVQEHGIFCEDMVIPDALTDPGKYAIERILPEKGSKFTSDTACQFTQSLFAIVETIEESEKNNLINVAFEGFFEQFTDVSGTIEDHKRLVISISEELNKALQHACLEDASYFQVKAQSAKNFMIDLRAKINACSYKDCARVAGRSLAHAAYFYMYYFGISRMVTALESSVGLCYDAYLTRTSISQIARTAVLTDKKGVPALPGILPSTHPKSVNNYDAKVTMQKAFDLYNKLPLRDVSLKHCDDTSVLYVGKMPDGLTNAIYRNFSKSDGGEYATLEFVKEGLPTIKIRFGQEKLIDIFK